eukprot:7159877-Prymnesium_polylepis.1
MHAVAAAGWQRWNACGGCLSRSASSHRRSRRSVALPLARMKYLSEARARRTPVLARFASGYHFCEHGYRSGEGAAYEDVPTAPGRA